jgi:putative ABC transport system substrate-binding protein
MAYVTVAARLDTDVYNKVMLEELRQLGYVEGKNLEIERYSTEGSTERRRDVARAAVRANPDVIFVLTGPLTQSVRSASSTIPIVSGTGDPIAFGLTTSLAQPSGNVTGLVVDTGVEINGKRVELLKQIAPRALKIGFLCRKAVWEGTETPVVVRSVRDAAEKMGVTVAGVPVESPITEAAFRSAFEALARERIDALIVQDTMENLAHHKLIVELVRKAGIPAIYPYMEV